MTAYTFPSEAAAQPKPAPARPAPGPAAAAPGPRSPGLRARFAKIPGVTPKGVVDRAIWIPVVTPPVQRQSSATWTDYTTVSAGDFSFPQGGDQNADQLDTFPSFNGLVLAWDAPWLVQQGQDPDEVLAALQRIRRHKRPVELLLTVDSGGGASWTWGRWHISVRQITEEMREGEPDTIYLGLTISGWRDPQQQRRTSNPRTPATRILQPGDTLHSLSQFYYGTATLWRLIRDANGIRRQFGQKTPIAGHTRFKAGDKIKIPAKPAKASSLAALARAV